MFGMFADTPLTFRNAEGRLARARSGAMIAGRYYTSPGMGSASATPSQSRLRVVRFTLDTRTTFDSIATEVTSAVASTTLRWAVYGDSGGAPSGLRLDTGAVGDASTTGVKEAAISLTLRSGAYWLGCVAQGGNPTLRGHSTASNHGTGLLASEMAGVLGLPIGYFMDGVTGAIPAAFTIAGAAGSAPIVWLRKAA